MNFKNWLLSELTLWHGTVIDNVPSIKNIGLVPDVGDFTKDAYGSQIPEKYLKDLVFAADKHTLDKALSAMVGQIAIKLKKDFHDVTDQDIRVHGALLKIKNGEEYFNKFDPYDIKQADAGPQVEPEDWYSDNYIGVDNIITGNKLISVMKSYNLLPRNWGPDSKKAKQELEIKKLVKKYPLFNKNDIISTVRGL